MKTRVDEPLVSLPPTSPNMLTTSSIFQESARSSKQGKKNTSVVHFQEDEPASASKPLERKKTQFRNAQALMNKLSTPGKEPSSSVETESPNTTKQKAAVAL